MTEKDYSGTPLWKKLGMKEGSDVFVGAAPYPKAPKLAPFPAGVKIRRRPGEGSIDVIVFFVTDGARHKSAAIDADWQGLRFVVRKDDRASWPNALRRPTTR